MLPKEYNLYLVPQTKEHIPHKEHMGISGIRYRHLFDILILHKRNDTEAHRKHNPGVLPVEGTHEEDILRQLQAHENTASDHASGSYDKRQQRILHREIADTYKACDRAFIRKQKCSYQTADNTREQHQGTHES